MYFADIKIDTGYILKMYSGKEPPEIRDSNIARVIITEHEFNTGYITEENKKECIEEYQQNRR